MAETSGNGGAKELRGMIYDTIKAVDRKVDKLSDKMDNVQSEVGIIKSDMQREITTIKLEVNSIKVENRIKTTVFGLIGGLIPALGVLIYFLASMK